MKTAAFLFASILALPSLQAGLRSQAGDARSQNECVTCSYLGLFDICVPIEKSIAGSKWTCEFQDKNVEVDADLWACLMTGVDSASCTGATNGTCIWCAEPVLGLCVTPEVASKLNFLPFFACDSYIIPDSQV